MTPFQGWQNFCVIVGSAAGGLIGLQFVVITLIADKLAKRVTWVAHPYYYSLLEFITHGTQ